MEGKKGIFSRILVAICITVIVVYTIIIVYNYMKTGREPTTITISVYTFFGSELGFLAVKRVMCGQKAAATYQPNGGYMGSIGGGIIGDLTAGDDIAPTDG